MCRQYEPVAASSVTFSEIESCMYKRRRLHRPVLPRSASEVPGIVSSSLYASLNDAPFYRGYVEVSEGSAVLFASV